MRLLMLTRYGMLGASSRMRSHQYLLPLTAAGIQVDSEALFDDEQLARRYRIGRYRADALASSTLKRLAGLRRGKHYDLVWIEKEALPWAPAWIECSLLGHARYVLDFDDAIFHNYDLNPRSAVRHLLGRKIDRLMQSASLVIAGNDYLADRARRAGSPHVEVIPTVIDLNRYLRAPEAPVPRPAPPRIVWIGSPSTLPYLTGIGPALRDLTTRHPFVLRVIGGNIDLPGVTTECLPWSADSEVADLASSDIGIMPLPDTPWARGKCAYKLIQYMACGLPTVASPVGANNQVISDGHTGYLASTPQQWVERLEALLRTPDLRHRMGCAGRLSVEQHYCLQVTAPRLAELLVATAHR